MQNQKTSYDALVERRNRLLQEEKATKSIRRKSDLIASVREITDEMRRIELEVRRGVEARCFSRLSTK